MSSRGPGRSPRFTFVSIDGSGAAGTRAIHERLALLPEITGIEGVDGGDGSTLAVRRRGFFAELRTDWNPPDLHMARRSTSPSAATWSAAR